MLDSATDSRWNGHQFTANRAVTLRVADVQCLLILTQVLRVGNTMLRFILQLRARDDNASIRNSQVTGPPSTRVSQHQFHAGFGNNEMLTLWGICCVLSPCQEPHTPFPIFTATLENREHYYSHLADA